MDDHKPRTVYIDINHWYALGRADAGTPDTPEDAIVLSKLKEEVEAGRLVIPLSSVTYTELTENPRDLLRKPTADVMLKLSRLATIAPPRKVVDEELAQELNRRFGRPAFPVKVPKMGHGVMFAFGIPGRPTVTGYTDANRDQIEAQMGKTISDLQVEVNASFEYWLLATPRSLRDQIPGFEPVSTRQDAEAELEEIKIMVGNLHSDKEIASRPMDGISARQYIATSSTTSSAACSAPASRPDGRSGQGGPNRLPCAPPDPAGSDIAQVPVREADFNQVESQSPARHRGTVSRHPVHRRRGDRR